MAVDISRTKKADMVSFIIMRVLSFGSFAVSGGYSKRTIFLEVVLELEYS